ncbi:hypothetical protein MUP32_01075 [Candidatus Microgenomates bacterium]|nr:hypothetical protein [Candidatus Microgenomates bacterium]
MKKNLIILIGLIILIFIAKFTGFNGKSFFKSLEFLQDNKSYSDILKEEKNPVIGIINTEPTKATEISITKGVISPESLAKCLTERHFKMYGTDTCSSCKLQKDFFGDSFRYINYVDCEIEKTLCDAKGLHAFPVWEDDTGKQYKGAIELSVLANLTGCDK